MAVEQTQTDDKNTDQPEQTTTEQVDTTGAAPDNWRKEPGAQAMIQQITELKAQLDAEKDAKAKEVEEAERKRLEEEGKYKEIADAEKRKREELEASYIAKERRLVAEAKLAGIQDDMARDGALARFIKGEDAIDDFVAQLQKDRPDLWKAPGITPASTPAPGGASDGGPSNEWAQVNKDYQSGNPALVAPANIKLLAYRGEHDGKDPPGDWS